MKVTPEPPLDDRPEAVALGELIVEEKGRDLIARTRDGRLMFNVQDALGQVLNGLIDKSFDILGKLPHNPRITIDKVVICRETWRLPVSEFAFAFIKEGAERYRAARQFQQRRQLPRFVFARPAVEDKPFYVDFDSPMYVDILAKAVRRQVESEYKEEAISVP